MGGLAFASKLFSATHAESVLPLVPEELPNLQPLSFGPDFELNLQRYLGDAYDEISVANEELPRIMEWINENLHSMEEQRDAAAAELKIRKAQAYVDLMQGGFIQKYPNWPRKPTDEAVGNAQVLDIGVQEAQKHLDLLENWCRRLLRILNHSFAAKVELTRSSESTRRKIFEETERQQ